MIPNTKARDTFASLLGCRRGKKCPGLANLKKFLQHFGYIDYLNADFSDYFDDYLEYAITSYQLNFKLGPTGEFDSSTLDHIVRPRCGYPDIVNVSNRMHSHKFHALAHYSYFPHAPRWPASKTRLTYAFLQASQLSFTAKSAFASAFARWSKVTHFTFSEVSVYNTADIKIAYFRSDHGDGLPFDGSLNTLAHAFAPMDGRFHLDLDENWVINGNFNVNSAMQEFDLESVAVHEIGHLLGLDHSSVEEAIMYPIIPAGLMKVVLTNDDIRGIRALYGLY